MEQLRMECFELCCDIIDKSPEDNKLIRQAIHGIVSLTESSPNIQTQNVLGKLLSIIQNREKYKSQVRHDAIQSLSVVVCSDEPLIESSVKLLFHV
jgi:hypothetical protein